MKTSETEKWFKMNYKASGKKLDMGKSCDHFKKADDLPLDPIAETVAKVGPQGPITGFIKSLDVGFK